LSTSTRTASLLLATAAAAVGIGIAVAVPATASPTDPPDPIRPANPLEAHDRALRNLTSHLPNLQDPPDPIRQLTENFARFEERFGDGSVRPGPRLGDGETR
jgi:hypothetical protein